MSEFHYSCGETRSWSDSDTAGLPAAPSDKKQWINMSEKHDFKETVRGFTLSGGCVGTSGGAPPWLLSNDRRGDSSSNRFHRRRSWQLTKHEGKQMYCTYTANKPTGLAQTSLWTALKSYLWKALSFFSVAEISPVFSSSAEKQSSYNRGVGNDKSSGPSTALCSSHTWMFGMPLRQESSAFLTCDLLE